MRLYVFLIFVIVLFIFPTSLSARCDTFERAGEISYLNNLAANIRFSYFHEESDNEIAFFIRINNLHPNLTVKDTMTERRVSYNANRSNPREIILGGYNPGQTVVFEIISRNSDCIDSETMLLTNRVQLPSYNEFYQDPLCEGYSNINYCRKWYALDLEYEDFVLRMLEIREEGISDSDNDDSMLISNFFSLFEIIKTYYLHILVAIFVVFVIKLIIKRKDTFRL